MNAKHSHFTIRRALGAAAGLCFALAAAAQPRPFDLALRNDLWLAGSNAAGLRAGSGSDISFVELYGGMEEGGYRHEWESPSPWRICRISLLSPAARAAPPPVSPERLRLSRTLCSPRSPGRHAR